MLMQRKNKTPVNEKSHYDKFLEAFTERYKTELETTGSPSEKDMLPLYFEYKTSGKTPTEWLEQQEQN